MRRSWVNAGIGLLCIIQTALVLASVSCNPSERVVVSAAEVVNEVARRGDQFDQVAVDSCHQAEMVAVNLPDVEKAKAAIEEIRSRCDEAFAAVDALDVAIKQTDEVFEAVQRGDKAIEDLVSAAMGARQAFDRAKRSHDELRAFLEAQ